MDSYLQFRRASRNCLVCGVSLPELQRHPSTLRLSEKEETIREDICPNCWEHMGERDYFGYWVTHRFQEGPSPEQRKLARSERNEALWALFNALYALRESDDLAPQLFLVSHLLMKYRILQFREARGDGTLVFHHPQTQETFEIQDLPLEAVSFVDVKSEIESRLHEFAPKESDAAPVE